MPFRSASLQRGAAEQRVLTTLRSRPCPFRAVDEQCAQDMTGPVSAVGGHGSCRQHPVLTMRDQGAGRRRHRGGAGRAQHRVVPGAPGIPAGDRVRRPGRRRRARRRLAAPLALADRRHHPPGARPARPAVRPGDRQAAGRRGRARLLRRVRAPVRPADPPAGTGPGRLPHRRRPVPRAERCRRLDRARRGQRDGYLDPPVRPPLPRTGALPRTAPAHRRLPLAGGLRRQRTSWWSVAGRRPPSCSARSRGSPAPRG